MKRIQCVLLSIALCGCASTISLKQLSNYEQGKAALAARMFDVAQEKFKLALNEPLNRAHSLNGLAATFYEMRDYSVALEHIKSARVIDAQSEFLKQNEAKILAQIASINRYKETIPLAEIARTGSISTSPAVLDFSKGQNQQPLTEGRTQIESTSIVLTGGYERMLPTAQLEQIAPDVYNLVLNPPSEKPNLPSESSKVAVFFKSELVLNPTSKRTAAKIAIANGAGIKGVACGTAGSLRKVGIPIVTCNDFKSKDGKVNFKQTETVLYVNRDSRLEPELIIELIRTCDAKRLVITNLHASKLDVQVVIGRDNRLTSRRV
jgi:hypothetical protein